MPPAVAEREAARLELGVRAEIARRVAARRERLDHEARAGERLRPPRFERPPLGAAVALQHPQHGIPVGQRALDARGAEDADRRRRLAQQQQPGGVVDLRVGQQDAGDRRRADAADGRRGERLELLTEVRRGVDQEPGPVVAADRERRLGARSRTFTCARGLAHLAMAVPLRKAAAGGRAEYPNAHVASSEGRRPRRASAAYRWNTYEVTSEHSSTISNLGFTHVIFASNQSVGLPIMCGR